MTIRRLWLGGICAASVMFCACEKTDSKQTGTSSEERRGSEVAEQPPPEPVKTKRRTQWDVTWVTYTGDGKPGSPVGTSKFGGTFDKNWGEGIVYDRYDNYIGFSAVAEINMPRTGLATFKVGGDDGYRLSVNGTVVIDDWSTHGYREKEARVELSPGTHRLRLEYFEMEKDARVSFECDHDLLVWEE